MDHKDRGVSMPLRDHMNNIQFQPSSFMQTATPTTTTNSMTESQQQQPQSRFLNQSADAELKKLVEQQQQQQLETALFNLIVQNLIKK